MLFRSAPFPRWLLVIEGYYDDSGKEDDGPLVCLAGYLAPSDTHWPPFADRWGQLLMRHGLDDLHMKTFRRVAQKKEWDANKQVAVLRDFIDVIRTSQLMGFGVGLDAVAWKALSPERRKSFGNAQEFAFQRILRMTIEKMISVGLTHQHINVVFDQDEAFCAARLKRYFGARKADRIFKQSVPIISFADARICHPLQAADLLVWFSRRRLLQRWVTKQDPDPLFDHLIIPPDGQALHYEWEGWDEKTIHKELARTEAEWAAELVGAEAIQEAERKRRGGAQDGEG